MMKTIIYVWLKTEGHSERLQKEVELSCLPGMGDGVYAKIDDRNFAGFRVDFIDVYVDENRAAISCGQKNCEDLIELKQLSSCLRAKGWR
jgi:hypothetical protein